MESLLRDVSLAVRTLLSRRAYALTVIAVLGLGIGANAAVYRVIDTALFHRLPFRAPDRLVVLRGAYDAPDRAGPKLALDVSDWAARPDIFSAVASYGAGGLNLVAGDATLRVRAARVSTNFFGALGVRVALGRGFAATDGIVGPNRVAVLSNEIWRGAFHADSNVVGQAVNLSGYTFTIVGVLPPGVTFPNQSDVWIPEARPNDPIAFELFRTQMQWVAFARLADGLTIGQAQGRVNAFEAAFVRAHPAAESRNDHVALAALRDALVGRSRAGLDASLGIALLFLVLACVNAAGLVLAEGVGRRREIALRGALGATRGRIVRQLVTEVVLIALGGVALGLLLGRLVERFVGGLMPPELVGVFEGGHTGEFVLFAAAMVLLSVVVAGVAPALVTSDVDLHDALKVGVGTASSRMARGRRGLMVAQIAISCTLLVGASLLLRSLWELEHVDKGFHAGGVTAVDVALPRARYRSLSSIVGFNRAIVQRVAALPGVVAVGSVNILPLTGGSAAPYLEVVGRPAPSDLSKRPRAEYLVASAGYFRALGIPVIRGRAFSESDDAGAPRVVLINRTMAERYWPNADPIGARLKYPWDTTQYTVIGVVGSVRDVDLVEADHWPGQLYFPATQMPVAAETFVVKGSVLPNRNLAGSLRRIVASVDPGVPPFNARSLSSVVATSMAPERTATLVVAIAGALGLLIATAGLYGLIAEGVARRTREIGIRVALGARRRHVVRLVLGQGAPLLALGVSLGLLAGWAGTRVLVHLLYQVRPTDVVTFVGVPLVLVTVAAAASLGGVRRAIAIQPTEALRAE